MKFTFEVSSSQSQAKYWILAGIKRHWLGETEEEIQKTCENVGKELKFDVVFEEDKFMFKDIN